MRRDSNSAVFDEPVFRVQTLYAFLTQLIYLYLIWPQILGVIYKTVDYSTCTVYWDILWKNVNSLVGKLLWLFRDNLSKYDEMSIMGVGP